MVVSCSTSESTINTTANPYSTHRFAPPSVRIVVPPPARSAASTMASAAATAPPRLLRGPLPVMKKWWSMPAVAIIARRPFLSSTSWRRARVCAHSPCHSLPLLPSALLSFLRPRASSEAPRLCGTWWLGRSRERGRCSRQGRPQRQEHTHARATRGGTTQQRAAAHSNGGGEALSPIGQTLGKYQLGTKG